MSVGLFRHSFLGQEWSLYHEIKSPAGKSGAFSVSPFC